MHQNIIEIKFVGYSYGGKYIVCTVAVDMRLYFLLQQGDKRLALCIVIGL